MGRWLDSRAHRNGSRTRRYCRGVRRPGCGESGRRPPQRTEHELVGEAIRMRPNIVLIQADQMAAQALGAYGDTAAKTPQMDALARDGAAFDRAYCNTPLCAPS